MVCIVKGEGESPGEVGSKQDDHIPFFIPCLHIPVAFFCDTSMKCYRRILGSVFLILGLQHVYVLLKRSKLSSFFLDWASVFFLFYKAMTSEDGLLPHHSNSKHCHSWKGSERRGRMMSPSCMQPVTRVEVMKCLFCHCDI